MHNISLTGLTEHSLIPVTKMLVSAEMIQLNCTCDFCDKKFNNKYNLKTHLQSVHMKVVLPCPVCPFRAGSKLSLTIHSQSHDELRLEKFKCAPCDKEFVNQNNLRRHNKSKHEKVKYNCDQCPYEATCKGSLKTHTDSIHRLLTYECRLCGKIFTFKANLNQHKLAVHEKRKFKCNSCDYSATTNGALKAHTESKHMNTSFSCDQCSYQASFASNLLLEHSYLYIIYDILQRYRDIFSQ